MMKALVVILLVSGLVVVGVANGVRLLSKGQFSDGTQVESITITPFDQAAAVIQIKQSDGVVCYAIGAAKNLNTPSISCVK
ncbi:hypothetical protein ACNH6C_00025 [Bdellovibrio bacteriovorus]|uniref:hypothetical protein n=1 Tax=Bdellovibrio bacteriovorus TaxID=959 RepID=UPI003A8092B7